MTNSASRFVDRELETMPRQEFRSIQFGRLTALLERVAKTNPFYRERWAAAGMRLDDIRTFEDFTALVPTVDKAAFLADQATAPPFGSRFDASCGLVGQIHSTSGTSGLAKEIHVIGRDEIMPMARGYHYLFAWAGIEPGMRALLTLRLSTLAGGQTFTQGVMSYPLVPLFAADKSSEDKIDLLRDFDVDLLQAFSGYLQRLRSILERRGWSPAEHLPALKAILTGLQAYDVAWMQEMADYWGVPIAEHYGSTQTTLHMATCERGPTPHGERGMLHNVGDLVHVEVIDPETGEHVEPGEEGEIVVTTLFRHLVPVIRFRLGDKARYLPGEACPCGRPFDGVEAGTISRYDDMMKIKGVNFWPASAEGLIVNSPLVEDFVAEVSFDHAGAEVVTLTLEQHKDAAGADFDEEARAIRQAFKSKIGFDVTVQWAPPGALPHFDYKVARWRDARHLAGGRA